MRFHEALLVMEPNVTHIMTLGSIVVKVRGCSNQPQGMENPGTHAKRH